MWSGCKWSGELEERGGMGEKEHIFLSKGGLQTSHHQIAVPLQLLNPHAHFLINLLQMEQGVGC